MTAAHSTVPTMPRIRPTTDHLAVVVGARIRVDLLERLVAHYQRDDCCDAADHDPDDAEHQDRRALRMRLGGRGVAAVRVLPVALGLLVRCLPVRGRLPVRRRLPIHRRLGIARVARWWGSLSVAGAAGWWGSLAVAGAAGWWGSLAVAGAAGWWGSLAVAGPARWRGSLAVARLIARTGLIVAGVRLGVLAVGIAHGEYCCPSAVRCGSATHADRGATVQRGGRLRMRDERSRSDRRPVADGWARGRTSCARPDSAPTRSGPVPRRECADARTRARRRSAA